LNQIYDETLVSRVFSFEKEQNKETTQEIKNNKLSGDLNPRYFEEIIKLNDAKDITYSNLANMFNFSIVY
jgi:hypothetical protein